VLEQADSGNFSAAPGVWSSFFGGDGRVLGSKVVATFSTYFCSLLNILFYLRHTLNVLHCGPVIQVYVNKSRGGLIKKVIKRSI
jgi:hypothetical protein